MTLLFDDVAQASVASIDLFAEEDLRAENETRKQKATGRSLPDHSGSQQLLNFRALNLNDTASAKMESMSSISFGASYTSFGTSSASLCHSRWEITKEITTNPTKVNAGLGGRYLPTIPSERLMERFNSERSVLLCTNLVDATSGVVSKPDEPALEHASVVVSNPSVRDSILSPSLPPRREVFPSSNSRRQLMRRAQSEKSLGVSQATLGASCRTLLSTHNQSLSIIASELDDASCAAAGLKMPASIKSPQRREVLRSNSHRKLLMRQNSEKGFGASCAPFAASSAAYGASCSSFLLPTNWESQSTVGSEYSEDESSIGDVPDTRIIRSRVPSREVLRSNSRRQLMNRAQSDKSLGASFANFGASCRSLLSTSVLEEDSFTRDLDQSSTGITDLSSKDCGPNRELKRNGSRRQLMRRAQSDKSLGASFANFGASCRSVLSTFVLEEDSSTGNTDLSSKDCGPNRELKRNGSRRQLMRRAQSDKSLGASFANFGKSCSSILSIPWESLKENSKSGDAATLAGSLVSGCVPSLSCLDDSASHSRAPSRQVLRTSSWDNVPPKSIGASCVSQFGFLSIRVESVCEDLTLTNAFDQESSTLAASFSSNTFAAGYSGCAKHQQVLRTSSWQSHKSSSKSESASEEEQTILYSDHGSVIASVSSQSEIERSLSSSNGASTVIFKSTPMKLLKQHQTCGEVSNLSASQDRIIMELTGISDSRSISGQSLPKVYTPTCLPAGANFGTRDRARAPPRQPSRTWDDDDDDHSARHFM